VHLAPGMINVLAVAHHPRDAGRGPSGSRYVKGGGRQLGRLPPAALHDPRPAGVQAQTVDDAVRAEGPGRSVRRRLCLSYGLGTGIVTSLPQIAAMIIMRCLLRTVRAHACNVPEACLADPAIQTSSKI
jgi:hypothetical protein